MSKLHATMLLPLLIATGPHPGITSREGEGGGVDFLVLPLLCTCKSEYMNISIFSSPQKKEPVTVYTRWLSFVCFAGGEFQYVNFQGK